MVDMDFNLIPTDTEISVVVSMISKQPTSNANYRSGSIVTENNHINNFGKFVFYSESNNYYSFEIKPCVEAEIHR